MGGVELGFMSTTTEREVALGYMQQTGKAAKMLFEVRMGMIDRGKCSPAHGPRLPRLPRLPRAAPS